MSVIAPMTCSVSDDTEALAECQSCIAEVLPVIPRIRQQLSEATSCVERSVVQVCGEFQAISDRALSTAEAAGSLMSSPDSSKDHHLGTVERTIAGLLQRAEQDHTRLSDTASRVEAIEAEARAIQAVVLKMDNLTVSLKVLAINARIEAARAGDAGKSFAVVAGEAARVAADAAEMNRTIQEMATRLGREIRESATEIRERINDGREGISNAKVEVDQALGLLSETSDKMRRVVTTAAENAGALNELVCRAVVTLQFQDAFSQRVGHAIATLEDVESRLTQVVPHASSSLSDEWSERMSSRFTMTEERQTHTGQQASERTSGSIELF